MKDNNVLEIKQMTVQITGSSNNSKEEAVNNAFGSLKKVVMSKTDELIVYMRPINVHVKDIQKKEYTEKYLMVFMPRKKEKVQVTLDVTVELYTISIWNVYKGFIFTINNI